MIRWLQRAMFIAGAACIGWVAYTWGEARLFQLYARSELQALIEDSAPPESAMPRLPAPLRSRDAVIGLLEIPRLHVSVVAVQGDDARILRVAAGHLPDTPLPWQEGNASFAGHRDTFFYALQDLRAGDRIQIATPHGRFGYKVTRTLIVNPADLSVLQPRDGTALTLITCYPFGYLGNAPQRFVVHAARVAQEAPS